MAGEYTHIFTLRDIFNNPKLKGIIPLVNYKEKQGDDGKMHASTSMKTVRRLVFDAAQTAASPHYSNMKVTKTVNTIDISGTLTTDHDKAVDDIYRSILSQTRMIKITANNGEIIRSALKEAQKIRRMTGEEPKLYLRVGSMLEIETMNKKKANQLIDDVMRNIYYNPEYAAVQNKYNVSEIAVNRSMNYARRKRNWLTKVGEE